MFDFDHLAPVKPFRVTLPSVHSNHPSPVVLIVRHAGDGTPAFVNARAKSPAIGTDWERWIKLWAKYIITDWENVCGPDGQPVPFKPELVEDLLRALERAKRGDLLRYFKFLVEDASNFHDPVVDAGDLGKG